MRVWWAPHPRTVLLPLPPCVTRELNWCVWVGRGCSHRASEPGGWLVCRTSMAVVGTDSWTAALSSAGYPSRSCCRGRCVQQLPLRCRTCHRPTQPGTPHHPTTGAPPPRYTSSQCNPAVQHKHAERGTRAGVRTTPTTAQSPPIAPRARARPLASQVGSQRRGPERSEGQGLDTAVALSHCLSVAAERTPAAPGTTVRGLPGSLSLKRSGS